MELEVGVRDLRNNLSRWLDAVREGQDIVVTERGKPVARLTRASAEPALDRLVAAGLVRLPQEPRRRARSADRVRARGSVAELVAEQRR